MTAEIIAVLITTLITVMIAALATVLIAAMIAVLITVMIAVLLNSSGKLSLYINTLTFHSTRHNA